MCQISRYHSAGLFFIVFPGTGFEEQSQDASVPTFLKFLSMKTNFPPPQIKLIVPFGRTDNGLGGPKCLACNYLVFVVLKSRSIVLFSDLFVVTPVL